MNKYLTKAIASMAIVTLAGCTADDLATDVMQKNRASNPYKIPLKTALARAEQYSDALSGARLRSGKSVKSVSVKGIDVQMRSGEPLDTAFYLVNYNDGGFALLGADSRLEDLYAISDEGSLDWNDGESNPALQFYFDCIEEDARQRTGSASGNGPNKIKIDPVPINPPYFVSRMDTKCSPRIGKKIAGISDSEKYRSYRDHNNRLVHISTIPQETLVAAALHAYHKTVKHVDGYSMDWEQVENTGVSNGLCYAMHIMSLPLNDTNTPEEYGAYDGNPVAQHYMVLADKSKLQNQGIVQFHDSIYHYHVTAFQNFNVDTAIDSLGRTNMYHDPKIPESFYRDTIPGNPVVMYGQSFQNPSGAYVWTHHYWLLDGYIVYYKQSEENNQDSSPSYYYDKYLHCRWLAGTTKNDGYYKWTNVNKFQGPPSEYDVSDEGVYDGWYTIDGSLQMSFAKPVK